MQMKTAHERLADSRAADIAAMARDIRMGPLTPAESTAALYYWRKRLPVSLRRCRAALAVENMRRAAA